jgi:methylated-DNA-[protein]-cysteine S-methyltransferase
MCAMPAPTATARIDTPIGAIAIAATPDALTALRILPRQRGAMAAGDHPVLREAAAQLAAWFAGHLTAFDLPIAPLETEEGERLRAGIASIPYGETLTYGALADRVGSVARAVGQACKSNPFPVIIPCHRVVSTSGPEYYSGGDGPRTKTWLLDFEHDHLPPDKRTRLL